VPNVNNVQDGVWDDVSGETFLRTLLSMPTQGAKFDVVSAAPDQAGVFFLIQIVCAHSLECRAWRDSAVLKYQLRGLTCRKDYYRSA